MSTPICIVDYGVGNVASVQNMLKKAGHTAVLSGDPEVVAHSAKVILPGVGAYDRAAAMLRQTGLGEAVRAAAAAGSSILGICLGMQLLLDGSEEGSGAEPGLGLIPGRVRRFPADIERSGLKVPHMGWNTIRRSGAAGGLPSVRDGARYYFVHSYYADPDESGDRLAVTTHGIEFASMLCRDNVVAAQFHPEKSHRAGMALLSDFASAA